MKMILTCMLFGIILLFNTACSKDTFPQKGLLSQEQRHQGVNARWEKGNANAKEGARMVKQGEKLIAEGEALIKEGNQKIAKGNETMMDCDLTLMENILEENIHELDDC